MKVLLIEDDSNIRRSIIRLLRRMFDVVDPWCAESADHAIEHLKNSVLERQFDLVISDWNLLGERTGGDVLDWIEEHTPHLMPRFFFLSGNDAAQNLGVRWLEKPCDAMTLRTMIESVLGK